MVVLGGGRFLMNEVPLYTLHPAPSKQNIEAPELWIRVQGSGVMFQGSGA